MKNEKVKAIKLGTVCIDKATKLEGTLTHWAINMGRQIMYLFQPKALDDSGQPVLPITLEAERLTCPDGSIETVEIPLAILGTIVTDKASGFKGMAISFVRHINGCFHVYIQPAGLNAKTNSPIQRNDFDLRSCEGEMIEEMNEEKLKESKKETPSPSSAVFHSDLVFEKTKI